MLQVVTKAHEVVKVVTRNVIETTTMAIEENARDLQSQKDKVMDIIIMFIKDDLIPYVANVVGPKECWKILKDLYESQNATQALYINNKLHVLKVGVIGLV
jgi:DNA/RNA endonuclease G (NUC1)